MYDTKVETIIDSNTHWSIRHINKIRSLRLNCDSYRNQNRDVSALISFIPMFPFFSLFRRTTWHRGTFPESGQDDLVKPKFPANRFTSIEEEPKNGVRTVESVGQRTDEGRDSGELRRRQKVEKMVIDSITRTSWVVRDSIRLGRFVSLHHTVSRFAACK